MRMSDIGCTFNWGSSKYESHVPTSSNIVKVVTGSGTISQPSGSFGTDDKSYYIMQNVSTRYTSPIDEHDAKIKFMAELGLCTPAYSKSNLVTAGEQCAESQSNTGTSSAGGSGTKRTSSPREAKKSGVDGWTYDETKAKGPALDDFEDDSGKHVSSKLKVRATKKQSKHSQEVKKSVPKGLTQPKIPFNPQPHLYTDSQEYAIDEVLDKRVSDAGIEEYFIKWEGYSTDYNSWEPRQNVSESAVLEYERTHLQKHGKQNTNSPAILNPPENRFDPKITWKPKLSVAAAADLTLKPTDQTVGYTDAIDSKKSAPTEFVQKLIYDLNSEVALNKGEPKNLETETNLEPMDEHFEHSSFDSNDSTGTASSSGSVVDISAFAERNNGRRSDNNGPSHPKRPKRIIPQKLSPVPKPVVTKRKKSKTRREDSCIGSGPALFAVPSGLTENSSSEHFDDEGYAILRTETNLAGRRVQTILGVTQYRNKIYFMVGFEGQDDCYTLVRGDDMNLVFPQEVLRFYENRISWSAKTDLLKK